MLLAACMLNLHAEVLGSAGAGVTALLLLSVVASCFDSNRLYRQRSFMPQF